MQLQFVFILFNYIFYFVFHVTSYQISKSQLTDLMVPLDKTTSIYESFKYEERKILWAKIKNQLKRKQNIRTIEDKPKIIRWLWEKIFPSPVTSYDKMPLPSYVKLLALENILNKNNNFFKIEEIENILNMNI
ncbi:Hypothetical protein SRAE_2000067250 [Strongyloides ratti]|uniref:Uncharacterized protein n=1 Tax=Strongyloides ratti TaxID=34506 RepID=A0A090MXT6_STRRB|nr:Hypothetical protein SRAE_2000067250 [Strongyloides ratti]CEF65999.1 Hypothetical protein SRAE_2000067250 [Strongyloides ratti]